VAIYLAYSASRRGIASSSLAAIDTVKFEGAISIATTRKSDKRPGLLAYGAEHVIVTDEEDLVSRVREITGGAGARIIFDPIAILLVNFA
jgi:NADPH:quinone reductase-like Zn-dependent oxidoreductase